MANGKLPFISLATLTICLPACIQQVWQATYPGPDNYYSQAVDVLVDDSNSVFMLSKTLTPDNARGLVVSKYNMHGEQLWDYAAPGLESFDTPRGNSYFAQDSQGGTLFGGWLVNQGSRLIKLSHRGESEWQLDTIDNHPGVILDVAVTSNDHFVVVTTGSISAYDNTGEFLWRYPPTEQCNDCDTVLLDDYQGNERVSPPPFFSNVEVIPSPQNGVYLNTGNTLVFLAEGGDSLASLSAAELGGDSLIDMAGNGMTLATLASSHNNLTFQVLNAQLEIEQTHSLTYNVSDALFDIAEDKTLCYAAVSHVGNERSVHIGSFGNQGLLWETESQNTSEHFELVNVEAINHRCHVSFYESNISAPDIEPTLTYSTRIFEQSGTVKDTITKPDFLPSAVLSTGNTLYAAGLTGSYDTIAGSEATIFKYLIK
ncbi:MAG: hypothetical protein MI976_23470 [Pseudomonadales bacterium]|nr:hypothetical protein [Pseudomonadales bacterium]